MGYILPNTDQRCLRQPCPREMLAVGKRGDALSQDTGAAGAFFHWTFLRRKESKLEFQRHEIIDS